MYKVPIFRHGCNFIKFMYHIFSGGEIIIHNKDIRRLWSCNSSCGTGKYVVMTDDAGHGKLFYIRSLLKSLTSEFPEKTTCFLKQFFTNKAYNLIWKACITVTRVHKDNGIETSDIFKKSTTPYVNKRLITSILFKMRCAV